MSDRALDTVWRDCAPTVLGALVRRYGHFDAAEDAVQEALVAAARQWPADGVPRDPKAWLIRVASRRLVDRLRADGARARREERATRSLAPAGDRAGISGGYNGGNSGSAHGTATDRDDTLAVMLLCCHPALSRPSQIALTLRAVAGLSTAQIARAFLVPEPTMAQRISRAKARLEQETEPFAVLPRDELPARLAVVMHVLYLVFTEGHAATTGTHLTAPALGDEAIRLARELHRLLPDDGETAGLLALMLLTAARRPARTGPDGSFVPLADQDRHRWDRAMIAEGVALVEAALPVGRVGPYLLQAAIAAVHDEAPTAADTDWAQIEQLYRMLAAVAPGPVVTLNHAVAVAEVHGADAALALIEPLADDRTMRLNHRLHAVRAHLLERAGRPDEALAACRRAAELATSLPEQRHLQREVARLTDLVS